MFRLLLGALVLGTAAGAVAQEPIGFVCVSGGLERRIQVIYETGLLVPCEVHYFKDAEVSETSQVLWRAANEEGYCEARAAEFADKLRGWGWRCDAVSAAQPGTDDEAPEGAVDDTEALAPSETEPEPPRD